jgi:CRISPR-associated protein Csa3
MDKEKMIIVVTLGFEEKFALRAVTRRGAKENDEIVVLMAKDSDERSERAFENFCDVIEKAFQKIKVSRIDVEVKNFSEATKKLIGEFLARKGNDFVVNLSGGFRLLGIEVLLAAILTKVNAKIELELENSSAVIEFPIKWIQLDMDEKDKKILATLSEGNASLLEISKRTKLSRVTTWRRINKLINYGTISYNNSENKYSITEYGKIFLSLVK